MSLIQIRNRFQILMKRMLMTLSRGIKGNQYHLFEPHHLWQSHLSITQNLIKLTSLNRRLAIWSKRQSTKSSFQSSNDKDHEKWSKRRTMRNGSKLNRWTQKFERRIKRVKDYPKRLCMSEVSLTKENDLIMSSNQEETSRQSLLLASTF